MENNRSGFSFKAVGVVGFVLLTFILLRVLRLPNGVLPSEMIPTFLMLLLGILVLGSSFILLALGRIVELLQGLSSSKALLQEIRDETERVRIESQFIYEVQKDTLVKLTSIDETPVVDPVIAMQQQEAQQQIAQAKRSVKPEEVERDMNDLLNIDKSGPSSVDKTAKVAASTGTVSRGASFAASRLNKDKDQGRITPLTPTATENSVNNQDAQAKSDIKTNTDESTWSTLAGTGDMRTRDKTSLENDLRSDFIQDSQDGTVSSSDFTSDDKAALHFDKVGNLPVSDDDYDRASLDGSDDVVDDIIQPKTWKPVDANELLNGDVPTANIKDKITEVKDADVGESLDAAVVQLNSEDFQKRNSATSSELASKHEHQTEKPVFEDRLSQTEKSIEKTTVDNIGNNAVRFGSFPSTLKTEEDLDEAMPNFTLEDITGEKFEESADNFASITDKHSANTYSGSDSNTSSVNSGITDSTNDRSSNVFGQDSEQDTLEEVFSSVKDNTDKTSAFKNKDFRSVEDGFENAEDSFDDIREVFDTQAKKLATDVKSMTSMPSTQDRIKDSLKRASDKVARETSDIGKNLN